MVTKLLGLHGESLIATGVGRLNIHAMIFKNCFLLNVMGKINSSSSMLTPQSWRKPNILNDSVSNSIPTLIKYL